LIETSADNIAFTGIRPPLVKIDIVSAPPQVCAEQSASQPAANEDKFHHNSRIYEAGKQEKTCRFVHRNMLDMPTTLLA